METTEEVRIFTVIYGKLYMLYDHKEGYKSDDECCQQCCFNSNRSGCNNDSCLKMKADDWLLCRRFHSYWKYIKKLDKDFYSHARVLLYFNGKVYEHFKAAVEKCQCCAFCHTYDGDDAVDRTDTCRSKHPEYFNDDSICSCLGGYWRELPIELKLPF